MGAPVCAPAAFRLARSQASALAAARQSGRDLQADTLLVVGGLYGNLTALESIEAMAQEEARNGASVKVVFNGDFNFFNAHQDDFRLLNRRILRRHQAGGNIESLGGNIEFVATAGNVELAVAGGAAGGAGCGCNYPDYVSHDIVRRSDLIVGVCMCVYVCMCVCVFMLATPGGDCVGASATGRARRRGQAVDAAGHLCQTQGRDLGAAQRRGAG